jgi:hypothetical protein
LSELNVKPLSQKVETESQAKIISKPVPEKKEVI